MEAGFRMVILSAIFWISQGQISEYGPGEFGSLTLCPPGGRAFMMAWSLACEMKKRRKRETGSVGKRAMAGYRPATLTEMQKICCAVGCELQDLLSYCDPFGPWDT